MKRRSRPVQLKPSYASLEQRKLLAADLTTTCLAPEFVAESNTAQTFAIDSAIPDHESDLKNTDSPPRTIVNHPVSFTDITLGDGSESRSSIKQLTLEFDGIIAPQDGAFSLTQRGSGAEVDLEFTIDNSSNVSVLTVTFS